MKAPAREKYRALYRDWIERGILVQRTVTRARPPWLTCGALSPEATAARQPALHLQSEAPQRLGGGALAREGACPDRRALRRAWLHTPYDRVQSPPRRAASSKAATRRATVCRSATATHAATTTRA